MTVSTGEPRFRSALEACIISLRRLAGYQLEPRVARQIEDLSEKKEFLDSAQHEALLGLIAFTQQRTIEKLEAQAALKRLAEFLPAASLERE